MEVMKEGWEKDIEARDEIFLGYLFSLRGLMDSFQ